MMKMNVLVIGATGLVGNSVAMQLKSDGKQVSVMSRSREKAESLFSEDFEIIEADALKPESLRPAFKGMDGIFISLPEKDVQEAMPNIVACAKDSGIRHLVYISGCTVREENARHPMIRAHFEAEKAIEGSDIPYTILKLTMVMDMIPRYANNGKPFILGKQLHGWSWIHSSDIARMASAAFSNQEARNKKLVLWGSENTTIAGAVEQYNKSLGIGEGPVKPKPFWLARLIAVVAGEQLKYAISIFKYFENHPEEGDPEEAYSLLGQPQMGLRDFFELEKGKS